MHAHNVVIRRTAMSYCIITSAVVCDACLNSVCTARERERMVVQQERERGWLCVSLEIGTHARTFVCIQE